MSCCNHDCNQGRGCPTRLAGVCPTKSGDVHLSIDPIPELSSRGRIAYMVVIFVVIGCTLGVAAGAMGWAYAKWVA